MLTSKNFEQVPKLTVIATLTVLASSVQNGAKVVFCAKEGKYHSTQITFSQLSVKHELGDFQIK